jgi:uncharacterized protein YndB with AHSA1/START domain
MKNKSYIATIEVSQKPGEVFNSIKDVAQWWSNDFEGYSEKLGDEFIIMHPGAHYSKQKLFEVIPFRKIVWLVTESHLDWLENNKGEWTNTKMVFEIAANGDKTVLTFTHDGLTVEKACYARCSQGWDLVIKEWLFNFIAGKKKEAKPESAFVYVSYIKATQAQLWQMLTAPQLIKLWWGGGIHVESDWQAGSSWRMVYEDGRAADEGEILEIDPPGRMVIKWRNVSNPEMKEEGFTSCVIETAQFDTAVKLTVTHAIDLPDSKFIKEVSEGWPLVLSNLKSLLETNEIVLKERTDNYGKGN